MTRHANPHRTAAAASEVTTRLPGNSAGFLLAVTAITSLAGIGGGVYLLMQYLPQSVARSSQPRKTR